MTRRSSLADSRSIRFGCIFAALVSLALAGYLLVTSRTVRFALLAIALVPLAIFLIRRWRLAVSVRRFRQLHGGDGKDLLIVYSASPHWQSYIHTNWIDRWGERAIVLNRSAPDWQAQPEAVLWRQLAGTHEHTPCAIVIPLRGAPRIVRFYSAFLDYKHGRPLTLQQKERELENALQESARHKPQR